MERLTEVGLPVVMLRKSSDTHPGQVLAVINATLHPQAGVELDWPKLLGQPGSEVQEITPGAAPLPPGDVVRIDLEPAAIRLFYGNNNVDKNVKKEYSNKK
jgi:hypothetical protein